MKKTFTVKREIVWTEIKVENIGELPHKFVETMKGFAIKNDHLENSLLVLLPDDSENDQNIISDIVSNLRQEFGYIQTNI